MIGWRIALWAVIVVAALVFLYLVRGILPPFIVALLLSALLEPAIRRMRLRGSSRKRAVLLVWSGFMVLIVAMIVFLTPIIGRQVGMFRDRLDNLTSQLSASQTGDNYFIRWNPRIQLQRSSSTDQIDRFFESNRSTLQRLNLPTTRRAAYEQYIEPHRRDISKAAETFFGGLLGAVSSFGSTMLMMLFTPFFVLLILLDLEKFKRRAISWVPPSIRKETVELIEDIGEVFIKYLRGVMIVVLWYVVIASLLLTILGAPYAILLAILFSLIYLIPYLGPIVNVVLLFVFSGLSARVDWFGIHFSSPWGYAALVSVCYFVPMLLFDPLVYTRIVGNSVGLHPVVSFFVVFSGAALFGPIGMILAFPVAGSVKVILDRLLRITSRVTEEDLGLPAVPLRHRLETPT